MIANFRVQVSSPTIISFLYIFDQADLKGMETTTDGRFEKGFKKEAELSCGRSVVLGMGDGSMTTLTIADPEKEGIGDYLKSLPSRWILRIL